MVTRTSNNQYPINLQAIDQLLGFKIHLTQAENIKLVDNEVKC